MTPEMKLAESLGRIPNTETEKISQYMDGLEESDLEVLVLGGNRQTTGVMGSASYEEKIATADAYGRDLARREMEKVALGAFKQMVGHGMKALTTSGQAARIGGGAAIGAGLGALKDPGRDPVTGQPRSRLGNMALGAGLGAGAGWGAQRAAMHLGSMNNGMGKYLRGAQGAVSKGNEKSVQAVRSMGADWRNANRAEKGLAPRNAAYADPSKATPAAAETAKAAPNAQAATNKLQGIIDQSTKDREVLQKTKGGVVGRVSRFFGHNPGISEEASAAARRHAEAAGHDMKNFNAHDYIMNKFSAAELAALLRERAATRR